MAEQRRRPYRIGAHECCPSGRHDDVITSAGFRIGPGEIEDCLASHPAVRLAAVVGKPDPARTEIVKAFVVPSNRADASPALADQIRRYVRERLSAHEYPREIEFVDDIPLTTTGKVIRRHFRAAAAAEAAGAAASLSAGGDVPERGAWRAAAAKTS